MSDMNPPLKELQQQVWKAALANADNPLGYKILDAHFAEIERLANTRVIEEIQSVWDEGYERWSNAPQSDKHSQTQHVSKALFDRIASLTADTGEGKR